MKVDTNTFKVARHATWFVEKGDCQHSYENYHADTFDGGGFDFLLYAMCAAFVSNYRCFPGLKSLIERQPEYDEIVDEALDLVAAIRDLEGYFFLNEGNSVAA